uniref:Uncharacterized protein n=1 Tax=Caenorhabditis japonica TaxID=281687 RepID=A0A8R1E509_CAEJA
MPAVYIYREDTEVRYYRVLVLGHAHNEGDVLVLLADLDTQYFVDVQLSQLFEMPEKAGFKEYPSNVVFATLHGVVGLSEEEQLVMWKNIDEEERKKTVVAYLGGEKGKMPFVDMIWRDELGQLSWLSQIAKRRGAMMHSDTDSVHLRNPAASAIPPWANEQDNVMEFTDCGPRTRHESESNSEREELQGGVSPIFDTEPTLSPHPSIASASTATPSPPTTIEPFSASSLDLYALFDKASRERNMAMIFSLVQFARNVAPMLGNRDDWDALIGYMLAGAEQEHGLRL